MIMLKAMGPELDVGYYGAAYRVMEIVSALPRVVFYVAFTRFAQCHAETPALLPKRVMEAVRVLMLLVLPALVVAGLVQPWGMGVLFGEAFAPSVLLLAVLLPGLGVKMFSTLSEEYLLATGREKTLPWLLGAVALLIPQYGALGAALATVLSEVLFCLLGLRLAFRHGLGGLRGKLLGLLALSTVIACLPLWVVF
jgi:O-antigen/teichoic acid export membrane protein